MQGGALVPKQKVAARLCVTEGHMAACIQEVHDDFPDSFLWGGVETTQNFLGMVLGSAEATTSCPACLPTPTCVSLPTDPHKGLSDPSILQI